MWQRSPAFLHVEILKGEQIETFLCGKRQLFFDTFFMDARMANSSYYQK